MTINLTDPANHPANGRLPVRRIERVIEVLKRSNGYQNGGDMAYVIADAIKGLEELLVSREAEPVAWRYRYVHTPKSEEHGSYFTTDWELCDSEDECNPSDCFERQPLYTAPPAPTVPETLPCPVLLEPGLRFGKGVKTQLLFDALKRRAEYYAELEAMTPEQRAEHDAGIAEFKSMLGGGFRDLSQPVDPQVAEYEKIMQQAEPDCWCRTCRPVTMTDMRFVVCPDCGNKRCPHANDHRNACTGSNEPGQEGSAYPAAPQEVK